MSIGEWGRRVARIWHRDREARDLAEEMRLHVELRARKLGNDPEARYAALRQFGNRGSMEDASAAVWGWSTWEKIVQDVRHAMRALLQSPGFTLIAVGTLAVGLGMNTAVFSLVNGVMLRSLPYPEPDRLVSIWEEQIHNPYDQGSGNHATPGKEGGPKRTTVSVANIADYARSNAFTTVASFDNNAVNLTGNGPADRIWGETVSAGFFEVLGIAPALGRTFTAEDDRPGAPAGAMITYECWQKRFGGANDMLSREVKLDGTPYRVIGIMPRGYRSPRQIGAPENPTEFFVPAAYSKELLNERGDHDVNLVARLRPGVTVAAAQAALNTISSGLAKQFPKTNRNIQAQMAPLAQDLVRDSRGLLLILLGASALTVLITCINVANLMLVRAVRRQHESCVRMALGAGRWGLVRQCLAESLVLAAGGCAASIAAGVVLMHLLVLMAPPGVPRLTEVSMDWRVFGVAAAVATVTGLVFGLAPAWQASRARAAEALKTSARSSATRSQARWRAVLTTAEVGLSLVLLIGAGLLLRSFYTEMSVDLGFQTERVMVMSVDLAGSHYKTGQSKFDFFAQLEDRVKALPGVQSVAFANRMPLRGGWSTGFFIDNAPSQPLGADAQAVNDGYFETLAISLLRGRLFTAADTDDAPAVVIVNREFGRRFLNGADPVGHELVRNHNRCRIVGLVSDIRRNGKIAEIKPEIYFAASQPKVYPARLADFAVRAAGDPHRLVNAIQAQVWAIDRDQPVTEFRTMPELLSGMSEGFRFDTVLVVIFAGIAVLLACIGIFGVLSYVVNQRMNELGIRVALGASPRRIVTLVLRQAGLWIGAGVALGLAGASMLTRYLEMLLFQVKRTDPWTFSCAAALLIAVAIAAALIPAARGSRADPVKALRYD